MNSKTKRGLSTLNPLSGAKASLELDGAHAKVHLHVNEPVLYLSLDSSDAAPRCIRAVLSHALTVQTNGAGEAASRKHGAHSPASGFAIVRVDERKALRIVGAIHLSPTGSVTQDEDTIPQVEVMAGKHWLKITPSKPLLIGEYALVEYSPPPRSTNRSGISAWTPNWAAILDRSGQSSSNSARGNDPPQRGTRRWSGQSGRGLVQSSLNS